MSLRPGISKIFIDGGSHLGEAFQYFSNIYNLGEYDFLLMEPNPDCFRVLVERYQNVPGLYFVNKAIYTQNTTTDLFANEATFTHDVSEIDGLSYGCSLINTHNDLYYTPKPKYIVECVDVLDIIHTWCSGYSEIILKLDIEGAECDVLERLIMDPRCALSKIKTIIVEFHSQYTSNVEMQMKEQQIIQTFAICGVDLQIWH